MANIYWKNIPASANIIDAGTCFKTESGAIINWNWNERWIAQPALQKRADAFKKKQAQNVQNLLDKR
jgi:hypothetical protein